MNLSYQRFSVTERWMITFGVMSATLMQILDTTIVNVALPHMQGSLGATPDETTWILTSYLVASAIFMPLTGYFTDKLGRKNYLLLSIIGFVIASGLCGAATTITQIVFFRLLQGIFGAALVPLSQTILADVFPPEERGTAMAIWGVGVMVGPILGPTLGGYLTEAASWRWNFYINLPVGILSLLIAWQFFPDSERKSRRMDWLGLVLISLAIGGLQYTLDRGNRADWFNSTEICVTTFLTVAGFLGFLINGYFQKNKAVFDLRIFKDMNFVLGSVILSIFGLGLFGGMVVLPLLLENLLNYPVITTGFMMAPRGITAMISMMLVGKLIKYTDPRLLILTGIGLCIIGTIPGTYYNLEMNSWWVIWPLLLQGLGIGMIFIPLTAVAFSTLPDSMRAEGSGIFSLLRTIGSSVGISILITIFTRHTQMAWNQLGGAIQPYNPALHHYLQQLNLDLHQPITTSILANELSRQAQMSAFVDIYAFIAWSFVAMAPLVFLIKVKKKQLPAATLAME